MTIQQWSTTPASNGSAVTGVNMATGSAPSTVHPSVRQLMADIAAWYASPEWLVQADVPTFVNATAFSVPGNRVSAYSVNRRVQAVGTGYTINGTVTASAFTSLTTVTVLWDSGALDATVSQVAFGILQSQFLRMVIQNLQSAFLKVTGSAYTPTVPVVAGATTTLDCSLSNVFRVTLGTNITTLNVTNAQDGQTINVRWVQDATGSRTCAFPASFKWNGGVAQVLSTAANARDFMSAQYDATDATFAVGIIKGIQ